MTDAGRKGVYFPNLDGLRFFCFLSVFLYHSFYTTDKALMATPAYHSVKYFLFANGNLGVNFFFVLSGFLITYLLLNERRETGKIDLPRFYLRRVLRIWPLFFLCIGIGFIVYPLIKPGMHETADWRMYVSFLNNFDVIHRGLPASSMLCVLWSVAIEEQFYLVWPVLLAVCPRRYYGWLFALIIGGSAVFRGLFAGNYAMQEFHTLSAISDMAIGGAAAWLSFEPPAFLVRLKTVNRFFIVALYAAVITVYLWREQLFPGVGGAVAGRAVIALLFALVICEQNGAEHSLFKLSSLRTITRLGIITYGMYCLHTIAVLLVPRITSHFFANAGMGVLWLNALLALLLTIVISALSYRLYERPFLRLKKKFQQIPSGNSGDKGFSA